MIQDAVLWKDDHIIVLNKPPGLPSQGGSGQGARHVDGLAELVSRTEDARSERFLFETDRKLARYIAPKGSVCLDGVSLTVNVVDDNRFSICIIPHTLEVTTLGSLEPGQMVNLEVDLIARYLERLNQYGESSSTAA